MVHVEAKTYEEAVAYCKIEGAKLAEPKSVGANNDIATLVGNSISGDRIGVWIGIDDKSQEGHFKYASDTMSVTYTDWHSGEPNNAGTGEDCVLWFKNQNNEIGWYDFPCYRKKPFICERKYYGKYI